MHIDYTREELETQLTQHKCCLIEQQMQKLQCEHDVSKINKNIAAYTATIAAITRALDKEELT